MKKLFSLLLCVALCIASMPLCASAAEAETEFEGDVWDGSITQPTTLVEKDGVYYYEITKCSELAYVAQTGGDWLRYNYILGNNLILNDVELTWDKEGNLTNTEQLHEWTPIGEGTSFTGAFDGNNMTISGLYINQGESRQGLFGSVTSNSEIKNIVLVNSHIQGTYQIGSIAGYSSSVIKNCVSHATIVMEGRGAFEAGGIVARANGTLVDCISFCQVFGHGRCVGGIAGNSNNTIENCINYGDVTGYNQSTGGILGHCGWGEIRACANYGNVIGVNAVGGIVGSGSETINCYNVGDIFGESEVGGISGSNNPPQNTTEVCVNCYNIGAILCNSTTSKGAIIGSSSVLFAQGRATGCYYLITDTTNENLYGCGGVSSSDMEPDGFYAKSVEELKQQSTYTDWDFDEIWSISPDINGGYPYLQWQEDTLSNIPVSSVQLNETSLSLAEGDYAFLTATVSPVNASDQSLTWSSSDTSVATVTSAGKVTAISAGSATITATSTDGGYTTTCSVIVTERKPEEYRINSIRVRDDDGTLLTSVPANDFLATVSITNLASEGDTLVFLAAYSAEGQYKGLMWVSLKDVPVGSTIEVTLPVENSDGTIAKLVAFTVVSFSNPVPLGTAVEF